MKKFAALVLLLAFAAFVGGGLILGSWEAAGPATKPTPVIIAQGSSLKKAASTLEDAGVLASADRFLLLSRIFGGGDTIHAGEYEIPAGASPSDILSLLQRGKTLQRLIAVPEGLPSILVYERLMAVPTLTGSIPVPEEGSVLPDS